MNAEKINAISSALANRFIERAEALGYKGKKRDDAALDYWCGAASLAEEFGNAPLALALGGQAVHMIGVRGFFAIKELANAAEPARKPAA